MYISLAMTFDESAMKAKAAQIFLTLIVLAIDAVAQGPPLTMKTSSLPAGVAGTPYDVQLLAEGGRQPYVWNIREGTLPPGLELDAKSGTLMGVPNAAGQFRFTVALGDSSVPSKAVEREYTLIVRASMTVRWIHPPRVDGEAVRGDLEVSNQTGQPFDLTVLVLAVNEFGKAFALGYQHFTLQPNAASPSIPFESTLPFGTYVVHADAVAEVQATNTIYRARMQTNAMTIKQP